MYYVLTSQVFIFINLKFDTFSNSLYFLFRISFYIQPAYFLWPSLSFAVTPLTTTSHGILTFTKPFLSLSYICFISPRSCRSATPTVRTSRIDTTLYIYSRVWLCVCIYTYNCVLKCLPSCFVVNTIYVKHSMDK